MLRRRSSTRGAGGRRGAVGGRRMPRPSNPAHAIARSGARHRSLFLRCRRTHRTPNETGVPQCHAATGRVGTGRSARHLLPVAAPAQRLRQESQLSLLLGGFECGSDRPAGHGRPSQGGCRVVASLPPGPGSVHTRENVPSSRPDRLRPAQHNLRTSWRRTCDQRGFR
jgi:hypothetical protein